MRLATIVVLGIGGPALARAGGAAGADRLSSVPFTYVLDYGAAHVDSPGYIRKIAEAPPTLLHLGKDVPFTHNWGPIRALGGENQAYGKRKPYAAEDYTRRLTPFEVDRRIASLRALVDGVRRAGVRWVTPYICSMTFGGHPDRRSGFWEFYDHWDEYARFGLGDRPGSDPRDWVQRRPDGAPHFFYTFDGPFYPAYEPDIRYAACMNHPDWRRWLEAVVANVARCGFDGVFVDNGGSQRCYCGRCRALWTEWLARRHSPERRQALFGALEPGLGVSENPGPLWAETRRFWHGCIAGHLAAVRRAGERVRGPGDFLVFNNGGERRPDALGPAFGDADLTMFERSTGATGTHPGMVLSEVVAGVGFRRCNDNVFENKAVQCLRRRTRPMLLTRPGYMLPRAVTRTLEMNGPAAALGCAENAAFGGGGAFLLRSGDDACLRAGARHRAFVEAHAGLYDGLDSVAAAGVVLLPEQEYFGEKTHMTRVRAASGQLLDGHVLFDYVFEDRLTPEHLDRYRVLVFSGVHQLSDAQLAAVERFVDGGGGLVVVGTAADRDEWGRDRAAAPRRDPLVNPCAGAGPESAPVVRQGRDGAGTVVYVGALPRHGTLLADLVRQAAGGGALSVFEEPPSAILDKVRVSAFARPGGGLTVVHLVNYNVPLGVDAPAPTSIGPTRIALPWRAKAPAPGIRCHEPGNPSRAVAGEVAGGVLRFTAPGFGIYQVIEIRG